MSARWLSCALALFSLLATTHAFAQASQAEMQAFPMPPPSGYAATKTFAYVGDYGYYAAPTSSRPGQTANASDYKYVRYSGVSGKHVYVYGAWGTTAVPPPSGGGDSCYHAHSSYGVWAQYEINLLFTSYSGWVFTGGGGRSGERTGGQCVQKTSNSLTAIDPRFGWGNDFLSLDFRNQTFYKTIVVGALSNTHGWGSCSVASGAFPACIEPSWIIGYTLP